MRTLRFYFDYLSSNAYLAWTQLPKLASRFGVAVEPIPVLFAGLLEAHGQLGPAEVLPEGALDGEEQPAQGGAARRAAEAAAPPPLQSAALAANLLARRFPTSSAAR